MTNAIAVREPGMQFSDIERLAESIAKSGLFGIKTKDQALALMLISQAEGRHPALAARDYDIIQGRPAKKAEAMLRDFLDAGGKVQWHTLDDVLADATFSHTAGGTARISWDLERATRAGLNTKDMYKKFPRQMLRSRVVSEGVRTVWPMATSGMYVPEEAAEFSGQTIEAEPEAPAASSIPPPERVRHSIAPHAGAPDEEWRLCLAKVAPALLTLKTEARIEQMASGPTCGDIMEYGPEWARAELAKLLADSLTRVRPSPDDELPEIVGQEKVGAG